MELGQTKCNFNCHFMDTKYNALVSQGLELKLITLRDKFDCVVQGL